MSCVSDDSLRRKPGPVSEDSLGTIGPGAAVGRCRHGATIGPEGPPYCPLVVVLSAALCLWAVYLAMRSSTSTHRRRHVLILILLAYLRPEGVLVFVLLTAALGIRNRLFSGTWMVRRVFLDVLCRDLHVLIAATGQVDNNNGGGVH